MSQKPKTEVVVMRGRRKNKNSNSGRQRANQRIYDGLTSPSVVYRRVMTLSDNSVSTSAGGIISPAALVNSANVTSCADWSSCAAMYSSYRVNRIRTVALPAFVVNTTAITVPALIYVVPTYGGLVPSTISAFADSSGSLACSGYKPMKFAVDHLTMDLDGDSHLWTPTNATITAAEVFGIAIAGQSTTSTISTLVWKTTHYFDVEFKQMA